MKRRIAYLILAAICISLQSWSQTVVVTDDQNVTTGDASSVLDVTSTSKGFLAPRMTEAQRTAISSPATGLLVYQTNNTVGYYYYDGTAWRIIAKGIGWTASGSNIYYNSGNVGIGNTSPGEALDVTGNLKFSGALMPANDAGTSAYLLTSAGAGTPPTWTNPATYFESYAWKLDGNTVPGLKNFGTISNFDLPFITNNTEKMRLTSAGRLGIGTNAPDAPLHVLRATPTTGISAIAVFEETRDAGLSNSVVMQLGNRSATSNATKFLIGSSVSSKRWIFGTDKDGNNSQNFYLWDDNSVLARLYIDGSNGYTGLGTASPQALLHVLSHLPASSDAPAALFEGESDGGVVSLSLLNNSGARAKTAFIFGGSTNSYQWSLGSDVQGNNEHNFYIYDEASFNTRFFIDQNGKVGIGNIVPTEVLDVTGNIKFSGAIMPNNNAGTSGYVLTSAGAGTPPSWTDPATLAGWSLDGNTLSATKNIGTKSNHDLPFITNNTEKMRLTADGKLGIGITVPEGLFHVKTTTPTTGLINLGLFEGTANAGSGNAVFIQLRNNSSTSRKTFFTLGGTTTAKQWLLGTDLLGDNSQNFFLYDFASGGTRLLIDPDGDVGIGTITPEQPLHVLRSTPTTGTAVVSLFEGIQDAGPANGVIMQLANSSATSSKTMLMFGHKSTSKNWLMGNDATGDNSQNFFLWDANAALPRLYIDGNTGYTGFGTLTPTSLLHIKSNLSPATDISLGSFEGEANPGKLVSLSLYNISATNRKTGLFMGSPSSPWILGSDVAGNNGQNFYIFDWATLSVPFYIDNAGKVGLGNNLAPTEVLDVTGNIKLSGSITGGTWSGNAIAVGKGGTNLTSYTPGSVLYASGATTIAQVTPNATATKEFLTQTSSGAPAWNQIAATDVPGALINVRVLTSGTSYTPTAGTTKILLFLLGGGGGGGGSLGNNSQVGASGGGGSGSAFLGLITNISDASSYTYSIGSAGAAGSSSTGNGGAGGSTTMTINGTTYTAPGGSGGIGLAPGTAVAIAAGGAGGAVSTGGSGHMYGTGTPGNRGIRLSGTVGGSGEGAGSIYGGGGLALTAGGAGNNATGYGAGGGGALSNSTTDRAGGTGSPGLIIIQEYR